MKNTDPTQKDFQNMADNAILWIEALKSGDYKKGVGQLGYELRGESKYCCLGVGCKALNIDDDLKNAVSLKFMRSVGLKSEIGDYNNFRTKKGRGALTRDNDEGFRGDTDFKNIVEIIMLHLDSLFIAPVGDLLMKHYGVTY